ncbi:DUF350 domain-containing protein [Paenibacillus sp.]|uniref:DUF350 domain-containing protein n=1 Tax=Paenibacillus sp. TaxID=58172 RepID=UPI002810BCAC|nr:DUF350 domain-containing protein [Paenibacillus sp.]
MTWIDYARIPVWTGMGALLLFLIMYLDSLTTRYQDIQEMKAGNVAVTTRFMMKLIAQAYILGQSIAKSDVIWEAIIISVVSFVLLFVLEWLARTVLSKLTHFQLEEGIHEGKIANALFAGSLHLAGALIIGAV